MEEIFESRSIATGTISVMSKTVAMNVSGLLHQSPDSSRLPVDLELIVLNRRRNASYHWAPVFIGSVHYGCD